MPEKDQTQAVTEIHQLMKKINQAWVEGNPQDLEEYFHPHIQFSGQNLKVLGSGRQMCINSFEEFLDQAVIQSFTESDHDIQVWGNTAAASYRFKIEYDIQGTLHTDSGVDLYIFTYESSRWLAVWRNLLTE